MSRAGKRVSLPASLGRTYLAKAEQFRANARAALGAGLPDAALLDAVHAGISAADAVTVALGGVRSTDPDHARLADLVEETAGTGEETRLHAKQLRLLIGKKNLVEYEARRVQSAEASDGVERADRLVAWATTIVERAKQ